MASPLRALLEDMASRPKSLPDASPTKKESPSEIMKYLDGKKGWLLERIAVVHGSAEEKELLAIAVSEFCKTLLAHEEALEPVLMLRQRQVQAGKLPPQAIRQTLLDFGWQHFRSSLLDDLRKCAPAKNMYKRIRDCLGKAHQELRVKYFPRQKGSAYAPVNIAVEESVAPEHKGDFDKIPSMEKDPVTSTGIISRAALVPQALSFWTAYSTAYDEGRARYIPVYTFVDWLYCMYALTDLTWQEDARDDGEVTAFSMDDLPSHEPPLTISLEQQEMLEAIEAFVSSLPENEAAIAALYFANDEARQEDVAKALGYSSAAGLHRPLGKLLDKLSAFMQEHTDPSDDSTYWQEFILEFYDACKKRYAASNKKAGE